MKYQTGAIFSPVDIRDYRAVACAASNEFPESFELPMPEVKNQGAVGSCVACALATVVEYFSRYQGDDIREMSIGYIYGNRSNSAHIEHGMIVRDAIDVVCKCGDCVKTLFPYNEEVPGIIERFEKEFASLFPKAYDNRFTSFYLLHGENDIKASLMQNGPAVFAMGWHDENAVDENGILREKGNAGNGHCMVLYGWCKDGWLFQNSWGTGWGRNGRAILPYETKIREVWGIIDTFSKKQREKQIEELEAANKALADKNAELAAQLSALADQIDALCALEELTKEQAEELEQLSDELFRKNEELKAMQKKMEEGQEKIALLEAELLEIKRPYDTTIGRFFAKAANAVINAFYWLFGKIRTWFEKK